MTIALGIDFGDYIFIAADTRTVAYDRLGRIIHVKDDSQKIIRTRFGLVTGSGYLDLLDAIKSKLVEENSELHTDKILDIIKAEWTKCEDEEGHIPFKTRLIYTYSTTIKNISKLRLAYYDPDQGHVLGIVSEKNKPLIIFPSETKKEEIEPLTNFLEEKIKLFKEFENLSDSIQYHCEIIGTAIVQVQPNYPSISSLFQIGIHALEGWGISPIIDIKSPESVSIELTPLQQGNHT